MDRRYSLPWSGIRLLILKAQMPRGFKIAITLVGMAGMLLMAAIVAFVVVPWPFGPAPGVSREIQLKNQARLVIDGATHARSEHGFSQRAGYRPPGSAEIEWFGDVSDGVEPQVYFAGGLVVIIDPPSACLFVRNPNNPEKWKSLALIFPNDLGPFPIPYYAERNGLTADEVSRINELGGKHERKYPTTYVQTFDPDTRDLMCSYQVENTSSWSLHLRLSEDGTRLALIAIGGSHPDAANECGEAETC